MKEFSLEQIGRRVRGVRTQFKLTREQFAEKVGISPQFLAEIENGKKGMSAETLFKLCTAFDISSDYILLGRMLLKNAADPVSKAVNDFNERDKRLLQDIILAIEKASYVK